MEDKQTYLVPFMQVARQRLYWAPERVGRVIWSVLSNLPAQIELFRIFSLPAFKSMVLLDPVFSFRHLCREYLFPGLSARQRTTSILHHYRFLISRISSRLTHQFGQRGISLLEHHKDGRDFAVTLGLPAKNAIWEGESLLQLLVDGTSVFHLQFTIVPGWVLHSEQRDVIFVQRLQGVKESFEAISTATKAFNDLAPPLLLVSVIEGIAAAWGIREMACISAKSQHTSRLQEPGGSPAVFRRAYDDFFIELGAARITPDFLSLALPLQKKPLELIGNGHRARTRRKRAFTTEIANRVRERLLETPGEKEPAPQLVTASPSSAVTR